MHNLHHRSSAISLLQRVVCSSLFLDLILCGLLACVKPIIELNFVGTHTCPKSVRTTAGNFTYGIHKYGDVALEAIFWVTVEGQEVQMPLVDADRQIYEVQGTPDDFLIPGGFAALLCFCWCGCCFCSCCRNKVGLGPKACWGMCHPMPAKRGSCYASRYALVYVSLGLGWCCACSMQWQLVSCPSLPANCDLPMF